MKNIDNKIENLLNGFFACTCSIYSRTLPTYLLSFLLTGPFVNRSISQVVTNVTTENLMQSLNRDSFIASIGPKPTIIFDVAAYSTLILYRDTTNWRGYFMVNSLEISGGSDQITPAAALYKFYADALYAELEKSGLLKVEQYSYEEISKIYARRAKLCRGCFVVWHNDHDKMATLIIKGHLNKEVSYSLSLINAKELQFIPTIRLLNMLVDAQSHIYMY